MQLRCLTRSVTSPQRLVERAIVILLAVEGKKNDQIGASFAIARQKVRRWRDRFAAEGMAGILQDKPVRGSKSVFAAEQKESVARVQSSISQKNKRMGAHESWPKYRNWE